MSEAFLEIVMPLRNPGHPLRESIASLAAQTDRAFSVLLSDNGSTSGLDLIAEARTTLEAAGISVRVVRPSLELGRVEHWNWAHHQATGRWLKPLFVGDQLKPDYVACLHRRVTERPEARVVRCRFETITPQGTFDTGEIAWAGERLSPQEVLEHYPGKGNWLGGPVNFAYEQTAWSGSGGYPIQFPGVADVCLYSSLALRHGIELLPENLASFYLHDQRFSHGIRGRRVNGMLELWMILAQLRNYCLSVGLAWPQWGVTSAVFLQAKIDYWEPFKQRIKRALFRQT